MERRSRLVRAALAVGGFVLVFLANICFLKQIYGIHILDDELGYWGHAAHLAGYDWSGVMGEINWYSYGYSLILSLLIRLARAFGGDMTTAYRLAIILNAMLCGGIFLLLWDTARTLTERDRGILCFAGAMAGALYCGYLFYSRIAWTECSMAFLTTMLVWAVLRDARAPRRRLQLLSGFLAGYLYLVHNRALGILLAFAVYAILAALVRKDRVKTLLCMLLPVIALVAIDQPLSDWFRIRAWGTTMGGSVTNSYGESFGRLKDAFSFAGVLALLRSALGTVWYLGTGTLGLFYLGASHCFGEMRDALRRGETGRFLALSFLVLAFLLSLGISSARLFEHYLFPAASGRKDIMCYGRYMENFAGIAILFGVLGLAALWKKIGGGILAVVSACAVHALATVSVFLGVSQISGGMVNIVCVPSVYSFLTTLGIPFSILPAAAAALAALLLAGIVSFLAARAVRRGAAELLLCGFVALATAFSVWTGEATADRIVIRSAQAEYAQSSALLSGGSLPADRALRIIGTKTEQVLLKKLQFVFPSGDAEILDKRSDLTAERVREADLALTDLITAMRLAGEGDGLSGYGITVFDGGALLREAADAEPGRVSVALEGLETRGGERRPDSLLLPPGSLQFGPYITLDEGLYEIRYEGEGLSGASLHATARNGAWVLKPTVLEQTDERLVFRIELSETAENVEFLLRNADEGDLIIRALSLRTASEHAVNLSRLSAKGGSSAGRELILPEGALQFGPYLSLESGIYEVRYMGTGLQGASVRVTGEKGKKEADVWEVERTDDCLVFGFRLDEATEDVEFLVRNTGSEEMRIRGILYERSSRFGIDLRALKTRNGALENGVLTVRSGTSQFGPYIDLEAGLYEVRYTGSGLAEATLRITADKGKTPVKSELVERTDGSLSCRFLLEEPAAAVEFILKNTGGTDLEISRVLLETAPE